MTDPGPRTEEDWEDLLAHEPDTEGDDQYLAYEIHQANGPAKWLGSGKKV